MISVLKSALRRLFSCACPLLVMACSSGSDGGAPVPPVVTPNCNTSSEFCGTIPATAVACSDSQFWPLTTSSSLRPFTVHYSRVADEALVTQMVAILETAWRVQIDELGFSEPLDDNGICGGDGRYDVFVWRGIDGAFVEGIADNPQTPHDDYATYMAIDPSDDFGGAFLDSTLTHEFNHTVQASDDWFESAMFFEMTATFIEALVYADQDDYFFTTTDFQQHPEWSLFYFDNFRTWYMYGSAMYLHFLRDNYFPSDPAYIARIWRMTRSDPAIGRPDFMDAIRDILLTERGVGFDESVVEFMRWRWFVAELDDGSHFERGADWPTPVSFLSIDAAAADMTIDLSAMIYGSNYLRIQNDTMSEQRVMIDLQNDSNDVIWRMTSVDGAAIAASVTVPAMASITAVAIVLPVMEVTAESLDFDLRTARLTLRTL